MTKAIKRKWIMLHPHFGYIMTREEYSSGKQALAAMLKEMSPLELVEPYIPPYERNSDKAITIKTKE